MRLALLALALALPVSAQTVTRVSVNSTGAEGDGPTTAVTISESGRWVAMQSSATNLVSGDSNGVDDVFLHDRNWGTTTRISVATGEAEANGPSAVPSISGSGERIAFESTATNLVAGYGPTQQIYVHDWVAGTTVAASATAGNDASSECAISLDGQWVVFQSGATNLVGGDTNGTTDVFLAEVATGVTTRLSVSTGGTEGNGASTRPSVSADGRWVTFVSGASNLVPGDTNGADDLFLHDTLTGQTTRVSTTSAGAQANGQTVAGTISPDGGYVALASDASNLVFGDTNGVRDIFVKVLGSGLVVRVSVSSSGTQASSSSFFPGVSWYGSEVSFHTLASLVPGDTNGQRDVYKHSLDSGLTALISATPSGTTASGTSWLADLDTGGRVTVFQSDAPDLVGGDTNGVSDAFVQLQKATWYIDVAGAGSGTGTPGNPYTSIQYAIDRPQTVGGDELLVGAGTYYENVDLRGKSVRLRSSSGKDATILDGGAAGSVLTLDQGEGPGTLLEGFRITNGSGTTFASEGYGGGIYCSGADVHMVDCDISQNTTSFDGRGGGLFARTSHLVLQGTDVFANKATQGLGLFVQDSILVATNAVIRDHLSIGNSYPDLGTGIGVYVEGGSATFVATKVMNNKPVQSQGSGWGGGVYAAGAVVLVEDCWLEGNDTYNGTLSGGAGGGICSVGGSLDLRNSVVRNNRAIYPGGGGVYADNAQIEGCVVEYNVNLDFGGGLCLGDGSVVRDTYIGYNSAGYECHYGGGLQSWGAALIDSCIFEGNSAGRGGAAHVESATFIECVFIRNSAAPVCGMYAGNGRGGAISGGANTTVVKSLFWDNFQAGYIGSVPPGVVLDGPMSIEGCTIIMSAGSGTALLDCIVTDSVVRSVSLPVLGGAAGAIYSNIQGGYPGTGNIDEDPLFWDAEGGDFHLRPNSPCIDAGDPASPLDPDGSIADMGAFPFDPDYCPPVTSYCTAGTSGNGCVATISGTGTPSVSSSSGFDVTVTSVEGQKQGIIFWGLTGKAAPWGGGSSWLCVQAPAKRTGTQDSGGTAGQCDGSFALDFNAWMAANPGKAPGLGEVVYMQAWFRDPPSPKTTSLSDGLRFVVCQ